MKSSRRMFILHSAGVATALGWAGSAWADTVPKLSESDPTAAALGYKEDAAQVDKTKFPKYAAGQTCANCVLYQGKPADPSGPCPIYGGKSVAAKGWCSSYAKKT